MRDTNAKVNDHTTVLKKYTYVFSTALRRCPAKSEGLVHYPSTQAPVSGSDAVTTQCADNAHVSRGSSLSSVVCMSNGSWSGRIPQCDCDNGYYEINTEHGRTICSGLFNSFKPSICSFCTVT